MLGLDLTIGLIHVIAHQSQQ